ncbi:hypothetical protein D9M71_352170 [compost metagenome]
MRFVDEEDDQQGRQRCRYAGKPEHQGQVAVQQQHQGDGQQRAGEGTYGVHRLAQAEAGAAYRLRGDIGDQRIARGAADAFADTVDEACGEHRLCRSGQGKQRLAQRRQGVAEQHQALAPAEEVADRAREDLGDQRGGLGDAFDQADAEHAHSQATDQEHRQQAVHQLRRDVHEQADKAQRPDRAGYLWLSMRR